MQYAIAHLDPNEDNPSMEGNPRINVDFENERGIMSGSCNHDDG